MGRGYENQPASGERPTNRTITRAWVTGAEEHDLAERLRLFWMRARGALFCTWLGGAAVCAVVAATRIVRFERQLQDTLPASERLQRLTAEIAGKLGVRRAPTVRYAECAPVPLLWCAGKRPTILLPMRLVGKMDERQAALILAHELAHLRRRDHWVRGLELVVATVYWWNPLVWVRRVTLASRSDRASYRFSDTGPGRRRRARPGCGRGGCLLPDAQTSCRGTGR